MGIENPPQEEPQEGGDVSKETSEAGSQEVLHHLHEMELIAQTTHTLPESVDNLERVIEESRVSVSYKNYTEGMMPTLSDLETSIANAVAAIDTEIASLDPEDDEERKSAEALKKLLEGRMNIIRVGIRRYVSTLLQFYQTSQSRSRVDDESFATRMQLIDRERRRTHDALINSLQVMTNTMKKAAEEGLIDTSRLVEWNPGMRLHAADPGRTPHPDASVSIAYFSGRALENRELVKDWAVSAELHEKVERIKKYTQTPEKGTETPTS